MAWRRDLASAATRWRWELAVVGLLLALLGLWHVAIQPVPGLRRLDAWLADAELQGQAAPAAPHPDIVVVDVDEASLARHGRWPWPRDRLAALIDQLFQQQQIRALGIDLLLAEPEPPWPDRLRQQIEADPVLAERLARWRDGPGGDEALAAALRGRPVVLGYYLTADRAGDRHGQLPRPWITWPGEPARPTRLPAWDGYGASWAPLADAAPYAGFFNAWPDDDGVLRRVPAVAWIDGQLQASLSLSLAWLASGQPPAQVRLTEPGPVAGRAQLRGLAFASPAGPSRLLALDEAGGLLVPFQGRGGPRGGSFRYVSATDVLEGRLPAASLRGMLVLLGSSAPGLSDLRATPVNPALPGVEVHAHLLAGLLGGQLPRRPGWAPGYELLSLSLGLLLAGVIASRLSGWRAVLAASLTLGLLLWLPWMARRQAQLVLPQAVPLLFTTALLVLGFVANYLREWSGRRSLYRLFRSYLPPDRARALAQGGRVDWLQAENRELTVLFCDLRGFSGIAEHLPPQALRELLNQFLSYATEVVHRHGGTLDKFIGDAVMAFWGAPQPQTDHAARAVAAALDLVAGLPRLNQALAAHGLPALQFGVGLATGVVCVGDLGSAARRSYTAVGDAVNLAARLEALTRELGLPILAADSTQAAARADTRAPGAWQWIPVDALPIRGRRESVNVFTAVPCPQADPPTSAAHLRLWQLAHEAAQQHHDADAIRHLDRLDAELLPAASTELTAPALSPAPTANEALPGLASALRTLSHRLRRQLLAREVS